MASLARALVIVATVLQSTALVPVQAQRVPPASDGIMKILPVPEETMTVLPVDDKSEILPGTKPWNTIKTARALPEGSVTKLPIEDGTMTILPVKTSIASTPSATDAAQGTVTKLPIEDGIMTIHPVKTIIAGTSSATDSPESTVTSLSSKSVSDGKMSILPVVETEFSGFTTITRS